MSHWQGTINWTSVKNSGKAFAFCKATEGATYTDPTFASNWAAMKAAGLIRGAYHFGRPGSDPVVQANRFCDVVGPRDGDLQMTLDLEATDGKTPSQVRSWVVSMRSRKLGWACPSAVASGTTAARSAVRGSPSGGPTCVTSSGCCGSRGRTACGSCYRFSAPSACPSSGAST